MKRSKAFLKPKTGEVEVGSSPDVPHTPQECAPDVPDVPRAPQETALDVPDVPPEVVLNVPVAFHLPQETVLDENLNGSSVDLCNCFKEKFQNSENP